MRRCGSSIRNNRGSGECAAESHLRTDDRQDVFEGTDLASLNDIDTVA
jgi:hypothetical protein